MFVLFFLIPAALGVLIAFLFNPVDVALNLLQIGLFLVALACGTVAYFQGFFDTAATSYFLFSGIPWLLLIFSGDLSPRPLRHISSYPQLTPTHPAKPNNFDKL